MKDTIQPETNGLLVPIRSPEAIVGAVERLRSDVDLRVRLGRAAHEQAVASFTWPRVSRDVLAVYESLENGAEPRA
jgi:glycosyltransferase involved in cell wall biosynthesis